MKVKILGRSYDRGRPVKRFFKLYVAQLRIRDVLGGGKGGMRAPVEGSKRSRGRVRRTKGDAKVGFVERLNSTFSVITTSVQSIEPVHHIPSCYGKGKPFLLSFIRFTSGLIRQQT